MLYHIVVAEMRIKKGSEVMNIPKLKGKIVERGFTMVAFAKASNIRPATFFRRTRFAGETFTIGEVQRMAKVLNLNKEEATEIFLP